jgi:hypothetical protein
MDITFGKWNARSLYNRFTEDSNKQTSKVIGQIQWQYKRSNRTMTAVNQETITNFPMGI